GVGGEVRPGRAGDPCRDRNRHIVQTDDLAVPLREVIRDDDHATTSTPRTRRSRMSADTTTRPTMTSSETIQGVSYCGGRRKMMSPICVKSADTEIQENAELRVTTYMTP